MAQQVLVSLAMMGVRKILDKPQQRPRAIAELVEMQMQNSEYGVAIPKIYGGMRVAGNIIWSTDIATPGGVGWGSDEGNQTVPTWVSLAIGLCEGPMDRILRIWADGEVIYNRKTGNATATQMDNLDITFYSGNESQIADPLMESVEGAGNVPAYRGLCYVVFQDFPLRDYGNRIPNFEFEVVSGTTEVVSSVELTDVTGISTDRDNIVFFPDDIHFLIQSDNNWYKINTLNNTTIVEVSHGSPEIPLNDGGFDIDENGTIHTAKEGGSGFAKLCRLDGDTLAEVAADTTQINYPRVVRVFRTSTYPYVIGVLINGGIGETLYITHRNDYTDDISLSAPTNTDWASVDLDEADGIVWAVATGQGASTYTKIVKISLFGSGTYTQQIWEVTSDIQRGDSIMFDADTNQIIIGSSSQTKLSFFDADDMSHFADVSFTDTEFHVLSALRRGAHEGYLYLALLDLANGYHTAYEIDVANRQQTDSWDLDESGLCGCGSGDDTGSCYDIVTHAMILACTVDSSTDYVKMLLSRGQSTAVLLSSVVEDICAVAGLDGSGDVDTSDLTAFVDGYALVQRATARDALDPLMTAFFFDCVDSDGILQFVTRGGSVVLNIPETDLAAHIAGSERPQELVTTRRQELELPVRVDVTYIDKDANYVVGNQSEQRMITQSDELLTLRLPIAMDKDTAKQIAVKRLAAEWAGRIRHTIQTHRGYSWLNPADIITVTEGDFIHKSRIEIMGFGGGVITFQLVNEDSEVYISDATGAELPPEEPDVQYPGPTLLVLIDCPIVNTVNNKSGFYIAVVGYTSYWTGASIVQSTTGAWNGFERPILISYKDALVGKAVDVLANITDPWVWDEGSSVNVRLLDPTDSLSSATEAQVLNGSNLAILGDEIIQYKTVVAESDGSYTLSGLLRGRYGTEWAIGSHAISEYFVPLDESLITFVELPESDIDASLWYRAHTHNSSDYTVTQPFTYVGRHLMPWSPQEVAGTRDGSNNLTITWTRRTRIGGEWADGGDVSLGETSESYSLDIYDGSVVVRTIAVTAETASYTAAQQVTDFGSEQSSVDIIVYQISSVVGRGFGTTATV